MKNFIEDYTFATIVIITLLVIFTFSFVAANFIDFPNTKNSFVSVADADVLHTYTVTSKEVGGKYGDVPYLYYIDEEGNGGRTSVTTAQYATMNVGDQFYTIDLGNNYWVNFGHLVGLSFGIVFVLAILVIFVFVGRAVV